MTIYMTAKEWLNRGYKLNEEIDELLDEQHRAFERTQSVTCGIGNEKVQTTKKNSSENKITAYIEYSVMIDRRIDELYAIKQEILSAINKVNDNVLRTLLIKRYIGFETWEKIAATMGYSYVHIVHRLHVKALKKAGEVIPLPDKT